MVVVGCSGLPGSAGGRPRFSVVSENMEPTLKRGDTVRADRVDPDKYAPRRGDVVVFRDPTSRGNGAELYISRIIAVGAATIGCCDPAGNVTVDGVALDEPYVVHNSPLDGDQGCGGARPFGLTDVPAGEVFVMGDNRPHSGDSRCMGPVPVSRIVAIVDRGPDPAAVPAMSGLIERARLLAALAKMASRQSGRVLSGSGSDR
jgi:signal peptidase I